MAKFTVFSNRWKHDDDYRVERTANGWKINHIAIGGSCDKEGKPYLYENFEQDFISYPSKIPYLMEVLWEYAEENGLTDEALQPHLDTLSQWVRDCEKGRPGGIFNR